MCGGGVPPWPPCPCLSSALSPYGSLGPPPGGSRPVSPSCGKVACIYPPNPICLVPVLLSVGRVGFPTPCHSVGRGIRPSPTIFFVGRVGHSLGSRHQPRQMVRVHQALKIHCKQPPSGGFRKAFPTLQGPCHCHGSRRDGAARACCIPPAPAFDRIPLASTRRFCRCQRQRCCLVVAFLFPCALAQRLVGAIAFYLMMLPHYYGAVSSNCLHPPSPLFFCLYLSSSFSPTAPRHPSPSPSVLRFPRRSFCAPHGRLGVSKG